MSCADTPEKVRYIRVRAWWSANDGLRPDRSRGTPSLSAEARANMESLLNSLSESDEQQRLMKAELARELGRFEEAERLLSGEYSEELQHAVKRICALVKQRSALVATFE
jgi:hypothetical protein